MNLELNCRGFQCPEPVMRCRAFLMAKRPEAFEVIVDNKAALENVSRFLSRNGYLSTPSQISESEWRIAASRSGEITEKEPLTQTDADRNYKTIVLLTTETLGRGDEELGAKLMSTFLANLSELGESLWRVILLNGAVKLCAREGEALESLQALAASGVGIFVCGTCLGHYGLLDKKQVGETTNMLDILTSLSLAQKVIRP